MRLRLLLLALCALGALGGWALGCGSSTPPPRRPPTVLERRACLEAPPPEPPAGIVWSECPGWAVCLDAPSMRALWTWLIQLRRYAGDAFDRCGPLPKETP